MTTKEWKAKHKDKVKAQSAKQYERGTKIINRFKEQPCVDCRNKFPPECMDFDHVRGEKVRIVSNLKSCSLDTLLSEIAKCELVCANCHRVRTKARQKGGM